MRGDPNKSAHRVVNSSLVPWGGNVLSQKLESASALAFNRDKTRAASNGRCTVGALCPFNSMTSAAAMY